MAGIKRKSAAPTHPEIKSKSKKPKFDAPTDKRSARKDATKPAKRAKVKHESDDLIESDTSEDDNGFYGFSADKSAALSGSEGEESGFDSDIDGVDESEPKEKPKQDSKYKADKVSKKDQKGGSKGSQANESGEKKSSTLEGLNATSSREAHAKQKALAKERKAAKPNAEAIEQLMQLWEKLRQKTNVTKEERKELVDQTFDIMSGRIKDFVFKHDAVRVIQSALKYTTSMDQRRIVAQELKGEFRGLAEGKYSKFLIAKLLERGDTGIRDMVMAEFYGHVRRLIHHPEASWILDDTYRQLATPEQKSRLLREWYGPEFSIKGLGTKTPDTGDLSAILEQFPEKRKPIMDYLEVQINQFIQKKQTGFTMLHDAMLQYFLTCKPGTSEASDFLEHLKPDATLKEGEEADNIDLLKNLAFTKPGSRLVSLALAYGTAKDRKILLRPYKDTIEMMAYDAHAHHVLLAALAVIDDTKLTSKSIFGELLPSDDSLPEKVLNLTNDARARTVLLYPLAANSKWLLDEETRERLSELYAIREITSKKDPNTRLQEIVKNIEPQLLTAVTARTTDFASFSFGQQFLGEVLMGAPDVEPKKRKEALAEVARLSHQIVDSGGVGKNVVKTLVQGGHFDPKTKTVIPVNPPLGFADIFWNQIQKDIIQWSTGQGSFVIVGLTEAEGFDKKDEVLGALRKGRKQLEAAAKAPTDAPVAKKQKLKKGDGAQGKKSGNAGARILLEKL